MNEEEPTGGLAPLPPKPEARAYTDGRAMPEMVRDVGRIVGEFRVSGHTDAVFIGSLHVARRLLPPTQDPGGT